jgi:CRISPR-associated protein Csd2
MTLFRRILPKLNDGIAVPRDFSDYNVSVNEESMPSGVTLIKKVA